MVNAGCSVLPSEYIHTLLSKPKASVEESGETSQPYMMNAACLGDGPGGRTSFCSEPSGRTRYSSFVYPITRYRPSGVQPKLKEWVFPLVSFPALPSFREGSCEKTWLRCARVGGMSLSSFSHANCSPSGDHAMPQNRFARAMTAVRFVDKCITVISVSPAALPLTKATKNISGDQAIPRTGHRAACDENC